MAKIKDACPKSTSGSYERLFGNKQLGDLITKVQSTSITNGTELEHLIALKSQRISDLDAFLDECNANQIVNGSYLCEKQTVAKSHYKLDKHQPDFLVFILEEKQKKCLIIELKDGDSFDTKKSQSELDTLTLFKNHIGPRINFITDFYICSFNQLDKDLIVKGFKNKFNLEQVMTGKELCDLLNINYEDILSERNSQDENLDYFIEELTRIPVVVKKYKNFANTHIDEADFYNSENYLENEAN